MKKIIILILALTLVLLTGCGNKAIYKDKTYKVTQAEDKVIVSLRKITVVPTLHSAAKEYIDTELMPCLTILKYENNKLTVSSHDYDADAKKNFKTKTLSAANNIVFESLTITDNKGKVDTNYMVVPKEAYMYIGEFYTYGYCEFNAVGEVSRVIFYGETIINS